MVKEVKHWEGTVKVRASVYLSTDIDRLGIEEMIREQIETWFVKDYFFDNPVVEYDWEGDCDV